MFDYPLCINRDNRKAVWTFNGVNREVEVLDSPTYQDGRAFYPCRISHTSIGCYHNEELSNLPAPKPVEPEVKWIAVGEPASRNFDPGARYSSMAHATRENAIKALGNAFGTPELHAIHLGCVTHEELINARLKIDRNGALGFWVSRGTTGKCYWHGDDWHDHARYYPTYAAALLAASNAARKFEGSER